MSSDPCHYMDYEGGDHLLADQSCVWLLATGQVLWAYRLCAHSVYDMKSVLDMVTGRYAIQIHFLVFLFVICVMYQCRCGQNVELLDKDSERLRHLLRWKELEGVFWKWMESVIDAKQASASGADADDAGNDAGGGDILATENAVQLMESHHSLQQAILKYESIVEHLERVCDEMVLSKPRLIK